MTIPRQTTMYRCAVCTEEFEWDEHGSRWYGSIAQAENRPDLIAYCCGRYCADRYDTAHHPHAGSKVGKEGKP